MTWGFSSYETRFRWIAALWAILMTVWCMSPLSWETRVVGGGIWIAVTVLASVCFAWWRPRSAREIPIFLSFEGVAEDASAVAHPERMLRPAELESLIRNLVSAGYRFQTVSEALSAPVRKSVVLVADGGTRDGLSVLLPLLRRMKVKATCFVACHETRDPRFLKSLELQEMARSGWVEFGGTLGVDEQVSEEKLASAVERNRNWLTGILGTLPYAFICPSGKAPAASLRDALQKAGYHAALFRTSKMHPTVSDPFAIPCRDLPRGLYGWQTYLLATRGRWRAF